MSYSQFARRISLVVVEYDGPRGQRLQKQFNDAYKSRAFYTRMHRAGRHPRIIKAVR